MTKEVVRFFGHGAALQLARGNDVDQAQQLVFQLLPQDARLLVGGEPRLPGDGQGAPALPVGLAGPAGRAVRRAVAQGRHRRQQAPHLLKSLAAVTHAVLAGVGKDQRPGQLSSRELLQPAHGQQKLHLAPVQAGQGPVRGHAGIIQLPDARRHGHGHGSRGGRVVPHARQQGLGLQPGPTPLRRGLGQIDDGQLLAQHIQVGPGALGLQDAGQLLVLQGFHRILEPGQIGPEHGHGQQQHHAPGQHQQGQIALDRQIRP